LLPLLLLLLLLVVLWDMRELCVVLYGCRTALYFQLLPVWTHTITWCSCHVNTITRPASAVCRAAA
jgi:hypothetical protein